MEPGDSIFACVEHEQGTMIFLTVRNTEDLLDAGIVGHTPSKSRAGKRNVSRNQTSSREYRNIFKQLDILHCRKLQCGLT